MCLPNAWSRWEVHLLSLPAAFPGWHHRKERAWEGQAEPPWASRQRSHLPSSPWWRKNLLPQVQRSVAWRGPPLPSPGLCAQRAFCCLVLFLGNHEDCSLGCLGPLNLFWLQGRESIKISPGHSRPQGLYVAPELGH